MNKEFQLAICPQCGNESVEIPIEGWTNSFEERTGLTAFFPKVNKDMAECRNGCFLTRTERMSELEVVDHMFDDNS